MQHIGSFHVGRAGHLTSTALIQMSDDWLNVLDYDGGHCVIRF